MVGSLENIIPAKTESTKQRIGTLQFPIPPIPRVENYRFTKKGLGIKNTDLHSRLKPKYSAPKFLNNN